MAYPEYYCRCCGLYQGIPIRTQDGYAEHDICDCCGVEFGYEDFDYESAIEYRSVWVDKGANWFKPKLKPENWSLEEQLKNIPEAWR